MLIVWLRANKTYIGIIYYYMSYNVGNRVGQGL